MPASTVQFAGVVVVPEVRAIPAPHRSVSLPSPMENVVRLDVLENVVVTLQTTPRTIEAAGIQLEDVRVDDVEAVKLHSLSFHPSCPFLDAALTVAVVEPLVNVFVPEKVWPASVRAIVALASG